MDGKAWELRLEFEIDLQNFIYLRVAGTDLLIHCDWQRRGYELVCSCEKPSQLFYLSASHLTGLTGPQCVQDSLAGQTISPRGRLAENLTSVPPEVFSQELSLLRFGKPRNFPLQAIQWACDPYWDPLTQEVSLFDLEEQVREAVLRVQEALSETRSDETMWRVFGRVRKSERHWKRYAQAVAEESGITVRARTQ